MGSDTFSAGESGELSEWDADMHCFEAEKDVEILGCFLDGAGPAGVWLTLAEGLSCLRRARGCRLRPSEQEGRGAGEGRRAQMAPSRVVR